MEIWKCSSLNSTLNKLNDCNLHKDEILKPSNHALPFLQLIQLLSLTKNKTLHFFGKLFNLESSSRVQILENRNSNVKSETFSNPKVKVTGFTSLNCRRHSLFPHFRDQASSFLHFSDQELLLLYCWYSTVPFCLVFFYFF